MQPTIEERGPIELIGMETRFISVLSPDGNAGERIGGLWGAFLPRSEEVPGVGDVMYGLITSLPEDVRSHEHEMHYLAAAPVTPGAPPPPAMRTATVPATLYAIVEHRGPIACIGETLRVLFCEWLPGSDYEYTGLAEVECYDQRFDGCTDDSVMEYWISVKRRDA